MKLVLTFYRAEVIASPTAVEGLEQVQVHRPDIIVSDISMPVMDGYQFIRAVREPARDEKTGRLMANSSLVSSPWGRSGSIDFKLEQLQVAAFLLVIITCGTRVFPSPHRFPKCAATRLLPVRLYVNQFPETLSMTPWPPAEYSLLPLPCPRIAG